MADNLEVVVERDAIYVNDRARCAGTLPYRCHRGNAPAVLLYHGGVACGRP